MTDVIINYQPTRASGRRKGWARTVLDINPSATGARAYVGEYLIEGEQELPLGTLVLRVDPTGSVKNGGWEATLWRVTDKGLAHHSGCYDWRIHAASIRRRVQQLLSAPPPPKSRLAARVAELIAEYGLDAVRAAVEA